MNKKYQQYTAEEMVNDRNFLLWLNHLSENHELDKLFHDNPQFVRKVSQAREIILLLAVKEELVLQEDINSTWEKIVQFEGYNSRSSMMSTRNLLKYAAAIILLLALATVGFWKAKRQEAYPLYTFKSGQQNQQSKLILSTGEEIDLKKKESTIRFNAQDNAIRINNDSLIKLSGNPENTGEIVMNQVVVPYGKKSVIELADGTKVWLNAGSKIAFPGRFSGMKREVFLEGEAYFNVTSDKAKPFFVITKEMIIRVLGTKFDVSAYQTDHEILTVLVQGTVSMKGNSSMNLIGKETILNGHQRAVFNKNDRTTKVEAEEHPEILTAWTEGWFPFRKEPLSNVFKKVERFYNVQFEYNELFPSGDLISGKLDLKESIEEVMKVLADVARISYRIDRNKIFIESNNGVPMRK